MRLHLLLVAACVLVVGGCANDGPPMAVATRASSIADEVEQDIRDAEAAEAAGADEAAGVDEPAGADEEVPAGGVADGRGADEFAAGPDDAEPVATLVDSTTEPAADGPFPGGVAGEAAPRPATVAVIGDSIASSAETQVTQALEAFRLDVVAYDAVASRRMVNGSGAASSGRNAIRDVLAATAFGDEPELWIVALGTNDVAAATGREAWEVAIDELMVEIPRGAEVVWVDTWVSHLDEEAREFNDTVRDELRRRGDVWVLDWHARAAAEGVIMNDGVHLTEMGKVEFARLIGDGLRQIYR